MITRNGIYLESVPSTQVYLMDLDEKDALEEFTYVYTYKQSAGRGQGDHKWESEDGKNICFSLLLKPYFINPAEQYVITKIISLAIAEVLAQLGLRDVKIKWPNDIYVKENKICGILVQNKILGSELSSVYVGIGLNVNQKKFIFAPNPTSLVLETGKVFDKENLLCLLVDRIAAKYLAFKNNELKSIDADYLSNLLFFDTFRNYEYLGKIISAKITGVNEYGHLILEDKKSNHIVAELRELRFLFG
ncbi:MAG: biotin--[Bacteroidales bacterium]|nr:biotin--[acetyl-CoA-carboxylase] ligase [Bacteroidales bacterium]